jgi:branched-chain amino acid transport system permease protein
MVDLNDTASGFRQASGVIVGVGRGRGRDQRVTIVIAIGTVAILAILPCVLHSFFVFRITMVLIYAIAIIGLNLLTGFNGQLSLGHAAFYAIGAYTAAIMMDSFGVSYLWTLPAAGVICFVFDFLFGLPALRLDGI